MKRSMCAAMGTFGNWGKCRGRYVGLRIKKALAVDAGCLELWRVILRKTKVPLLEQVVSVVEPVLDLFELHRGFLAELGDPSIPEAASGLAVLEIAI